MNTLAYADLTDTNASKGSSISSVGQGALNLRAFVSGLASPNSAFDDASLPTASAQPPQSLRSRTRVGALDERVGGIAMWNQVYNPFGNSALSTIAAAIPVVTLLVLIASGKVKAHIAAIIALVVTNIIAIFVFTMFAIVGR